MGRIMLFLLSISQITVAGDYKAIGESFEPELKIDQKILRADYIFAGEIEKIEKISGMPSGSFDQKVTYKVENRYKGDPGKKVDIFLCRNDCKLEDVEMGNIIVGRKHVVFANGKEKLVSSEFLGSFMAPSESELKNGRQFGYICDLKALQAYRNKKPMKDVIRISKTCK